MDAKKTGILAIIGANLMWSGEPVFAKLAYANSDLFGSREAGALQTSAIRAIVAAPELSTRFFCGIVGFFDSKRIGYSYADFRYGSVICWSLFLIQKRRGLFLNVFINERSIYEPQ